MKKIFIIIAILFSAIVAYALPYNADTVCDSSVPVTPDFLTRCVIYEEESEMIPYTWDACIGGSWKTIRGGYVGLTAETCVFDTECIEGRWYCDDYGKYMCVGGRKHLYIIGEFTCPEYEDNENITIEETTPIIVDNVRLPNSTHKCVQQFHPKGQKVWLFTRFNDASDDDCDFGDLCFEEVDRMVNQYTWITYNEIDCPIGGDKDEHGCLIAAGYSWCEPKQKCLRPWEESCEPTPEPEPEPEEKPDYTWVWLIVPAAGLIYWFFIRKNKLKY